MVSINVMVSRRPLTPKREVRSEGLEPTRLAAPEPKSGAAANYATNAVYLLQAETVRLELTTLCGGQLFSRQLTTPIVAFPLFIECCKLLAVCLHNISFHWWKSFHR